MEHNAELANSLMKRFEMLKAVRQPTEETRWEAYSYMGHRLKGSTVGFSPVPDVHLLSCAGKVAGQNFIDGFMGNLINMNQNWFNLRYESDEFSEEQDDIAGANGFLGKCQRRVYSELARGNFYTESRLASKDAFFGGASATFIHFDKDDRRVVFDTLCPWDWWCDTDINGKYNTFFYRYRLSAYKAYERFGDKLPDYIIKEAKNSPQYPTYYEFLLCIYPNGSFYHTNGNAIFDTKKRFAVVDMLVSSDRKSEGRILNLSGMNIFPVVIHIWDKDGDNPYGTSPVIRILPELRRLNMLAYETALSIQKMNHKKWAVTASVYEQWSDDPGTVLQVPSMEQAPKALDDGQTIEGANLLLQDEIAYIERLLYNDMFSYLSRQDKVFTATQVNAVKSEELSLLSAIFGNVQMQKIEPSIRLTMSFMQSNRLLPRDTDKVLNSKGRLSITLDSVLAQSLRQYTFRDAGLATVDVVERFVAMQLVEPLDNLNMDVLLRNIVAGIGGAPELLKDKVEVAELREIRAQQLQKAQEQQQMLAQSEAVRNMGGASNMNNSTGANQYGG